MKNKLNGRDFITIGIFNAIGIVIYMAVAFAMATTVIGGFVASGVSFMIAATVYILMAVKVKKKGVFTISGTLLGLIALSGGHLPHAVFAVIGGIICDLIIGNYESKGRMIIGYGTFALADFLGTVIPVILFGTASFAEMLLLNSSLKIQDIAEAVGYSSHSKFSACFKKYKGIYPREIKKTTNPINQCCNCK